MLYTLYVTLSKQNTYLIVLLFCMKRHTVTLKFKLFLSPYPLFYDQNNLDISWINAFCPTFIFCIFFLYCCINLSPSFPLPYIFLSFPSRLFSLVSLFLVYFSSFPIYLPSLSFSLVPSCISLSRFLLSFPSLIHFIV